MSWLHSPTTPKDRPLLALQNAATVAEALGRTCPCCPKAGWRRSGPVLAGDELFLLGGLEHFFLFPYIGNNHPNWLIFFRGVQTTNQVWSLMFFHCVFFSYLVSTWRFQAVAVHCLHLEFLCDHRFRFHLARGTSKDPKVASSFPDMIPIPAKPAPLSQLWNRNRKE